MSDKHCKMDNLSILPWRQSNTRTSRVTKDISQSSLFESRFYCADNSQFYVGLYHHQELLCSVGTQNGPHDLSSPLFLSSFFSWASEIWLPLLLLVVKLLRIIGLEKHVKEELFLVSFHPCYGCTFWDASVTCGIPEITSCEVGVCILWFLKKTATMLVEMQDVEKEDMVVWTKRQHYTFKSTNFFYIFFIYIIF